MATMIENLPVPHSDLTAFVEKHGFKVKEIKPMAARSFDTFETTEFVILAEGEDDYKAAMALNGCIWKGKKLSVSPDPIYSNDVAGQLQRNETPPPPDS